VYDFELPIEAAKDYADIEPRRSALMFQSSKRVFDLITSILLLPVLVLAAVVLFIANPVFNKGPVFYVQARMGKNCRAFKLIKFRSMTDAPVQIRGANDPLEVDRITRLGRFIRKTRLDELPQIINVIAGQMSLIGPRPDAFHHARIYVRDIPGYRKRHDVLPGISGLAQTTLGYAEGSEATAAKTCADLFYIHQSGFRLETWIFWRTLVTVFGRHGS
jgi:lipopolysaccharide/colanic/teichoic acid biosynthesis glycosyltransferase